MNEAWYLILLLALTVYAILDGFDLGVGALHLLVGKTDEERDIAVRTIGPVWNGNEVWLLAFGGSLVVAFPRMYASGFSGFYLALMLVLWLLIGRGISLEFRHQLNHGPWQKIWDVLFSVSSALLAVLFGVAVANVLRGIPLAEDGSFQASLPMLLNPYGILGGVLGLCVLSLHGATYLAMKTEGPLQERARKYTSGLLWVVLLLLVAFTVASMGIRTGFMANFSAQPALYLLAIVGAVCAICMLTARRANNDRDAFLSSAGLIVSIMASAGAALFPVLLPSTSGHPSLNIYNAASSAHAMSNGLLVLAVGIILVIAYQVTMYRVWSGKVTAESEAYH